MTTTETTTRALPNLTVLAPVDGPWLETALRATVEFEHPICFRLGAGTEPAVYTVERARLLDDAGGLGSTVASVIADRPWAELLHEHRAHGVMDHM